MAGKINWDEHRAQFERLKETEGLTCSAYAKRYGLNERTARRNLTSPPPEPTTAPAIALTAEDDQIAALLAPGGADTVGDAEAVMLRDALHRYVASQQSNIDYLQRACDSFDGLIPFDDSRFVEPRRDKDDNPVSPHKDLAAANLQLVGVIGNTVKSLGSAIGALARAKTAKAAALRQQREALVRDALAHQREKATSEALANFQKAEEPWSAKRAAIHIEAVGGTVPHVIRAQLALDMGFDADDEGDPISEEELDNICIEAELVQREREKILKTRAAELLEIQEEERALNADPDEDIYLAPPPDEIAPASYDDGCEVIGEPGLGGDDGE